MSQLIKISSNPTKAINNTLNNKYVKSIRISTNKKPIMKTQHRITNATQTDR